MFGLYLRDQDQESLKHKNSLSFEAIFDLKLINYLFMIKVNEFLVLTQ